MVSRAVRCGAGTHVLVAVRAGLDANRAWLELVRRVLESGTRPVCSVDDVDGLEVGAHPPAWGSRGRRGDRLAVEVSALVSAWRRGASASGYTSGYTGDGTGG